MPTIVTLKNLGAFAGATNLQLFLRKTSDNTLLAAGGDTGVDASSIGSFAWTVAEEIPNEQLLARIYEGSTETAANIVIDSVLNVGFTEIGQEAAVLNAETQAILNDIPTNSELTTALASADDAVLAAISALNNLSAAQVNAELLDVLSVDTFAELSSPPSATSSLKDKLVYLFMWARNKATQTATERKLYADDGTTVISTESVSDAGGTFTKGEAS